MGYFWSLRANKVISHTHTPEYYTVLYAVKCQVWTWNLMMNRLLWNGFRGNQAKSIKTVNIKSLETPLLIKLFRLLNTTVSLFSTQTDKEYLLNKYKSMWQVFKSYLNVYSYPVTSEAKILFVWKWPVYKWLRYMTLKSLTVHLCHFSMFPGTPFKHTFTHLVSLDLIAIWRQAAQRK